MRALRQRPTRDEVKPGEYFCSACELFLVEQVGARDAVVENCRSGELVDVPISRLLGLTRVRGEAPGISMKEVPDG